MGKREVVAFSSSSSIEQHRKEEDVRPPAAWYQIVTLRLFFLLFSGPWRRIFQESISSGRVENNPGPSPPTAQVDDCRQLLTDEWREKEGDFWSSSFLWFRAALHLPLPFPPLPPLPPLWREERRQTRRIGLIELCGTERRKKGVPSVGGSGLVWTGSKQLPRHAKTERVRGEREFHRTPSFGHHRAVCVCRISVAGDMVALFSTVA